MNGIVEIMKKVAEHESNKILTTELGIVTAVFPHKDDGDTENYQCTVKLKNKKLPDGSDFELRKVPVATPYMGFAAIPNVDDLVLVQFVGGNINAPVITHRLYNDEDRPPANLEDELLIQHKIDEGGSIKIDKDGKILITTKDEKTVFTVEDEKVSIEHEDHQVIVDISGSKIILTTAGDVEVTADGDTKLTVKGNVETSCDGDATVTAKGKIEATCDGDAKIDSKGKVEVKAMTDANVEATGNVKVKGATVTLDSVDSAAWMPCTVGACLFTGAPHGGPGAGIVNLKGK